jgi:LuxR family maltose regulon positive regulatory protein
MLIAEGSDAGLREAEKRLQKLLRLCRTQHNTFQMIGVMALLTMALEKQGRTDDALAVLEEVVGMASPGEWIRPFVEAGPTMKGLLKRLADKGIAADYIGRLLAAFSQTRRAPSSNTQVAHEILTNRELDVLELLAKRLRTKEIASKLTISPETVNTHIKAIFRKLKVNKRQQAVIKARDIGVL